MLLHHLSNGVGGEEVQEDCLGGLELGLNPDEKRKLVCLGRLPERVCRLPAGNNHDGSSLLMASYYVMQRFRHHHHSLLHAIPLWALRDNDNLFSPSQHDEGQDDNYPLVRGYACERISLRDQDNISK